MFELIVTKKYFFEKEMGVVALMYIMQEPTWLIMLKAGATLGLVHIWI